MDRLMRRLSADRASADRASADRATADRATADRATADRATADRAPTDRASTGSGAPGVSGDSAVAVESGALPAVPEAGPEPRCPIQVARDALARPVRRRGKELENAIFEATLDQLTSGGYARLTMEGVAAAARTGKAALYRRWRSKVELVIDALDSTLPRPYGIPDLGSTRAELLQLIELFADAIHSRAGAALHALMAELSQQQAEVFKDFIVRRMIGPIKETILDILRRGVERGEVRPGAVTPLVADVVPAMLMFRVKVFERSPAPDFAVRLVDDVLVPMIRQP